MPLKVDHARLLDDLRTLSQFGRVATGVHRLSYTPEDGQARQWLLQRMAAAGLEAEIDGIGNVYGRYPGVGRAVLIGSHTDTVPKGGWLDGAMGVIYGLEVARTLRETGDGAALGVDVISFADEEGTYLGTGGSLSFCGELSEEQMAGARSTGGKSLGEALREAGYADRPRARLDRRRHVAYLEAHIEQGPRLEAEGKRIGVVTGIVGMRRALAEFTGQADHAGTTPMHMRKDAGAACFRFAAQLLDRFSAVREKDTVWNLGHIAFDPGAGNVVPAAARLMVEYRDASEAVLDRMEAEMERLAEDMSGAVAIKLSKTMRIVPAAMDPKLGDMIAQAAEAHGASWMRMPSGAGHDAMITARHVPSAMLFIPSIGGRSHDVSENTEEADIALGADVLAETVSRLVAA